MDKMYVDLFSRFFVVIGSLIYFLVTIFDNKNIMSKLFAVVVGISSLMLIFDRDYYLPFLGKTIFPPAKSDMSLQIQKKIKVKVSDLPANVKVVYWAAIEAIDSKAYTNYMDAYSNYTNAGEMFTDANGDVVLSIDCPSEYYVQKFGIINKKLDKHVHYRYELPGKKGLFSKVYTQYVQC
uniref:Uncharacterized protein n=1 Tax=viral metagenome TaxID=1070528 RepID=A0A6C0E0W0_9ZZZZ